MVWHEVLGIACWAFVIGIFTGERIGRKCLEEDPDNHRGKFLVEHLDWCKRHIDNNRLFANCATVAKALIIWRGTTYELTVAEHKKEDA